MAGLTLEELQKRGAKPVGLTFEQLQQRGASRIGAEPTQELEEEKDGFLSSVIKDPLKTLIVKPGVRLGQAIGQVGLEIGALTGNEKLKAARDKGREVVGQDVKFPGAGGMTIEGQKAFGEGGGQQIAGDTLKSASYLYPAARVETIASNLFKGQILRSMAGGTASGAVGGGLYSAGESVEEEGTPFTYDTLFGTATGALAGGLFSGLGATGAKMYNNFKAFRTADDARKILSREYERVINPTQSQRRVLTQEGRDMGDFLANELGTEPGIKLTSDGKLDLSEPLEALKTKYHAEELALDRLLESDIRQFGWKDIQSKARQKINSNLSGTQRIKALKALDEEIEAYIEQFGESVGLDKINAFKRDMWSRTTGFGSAEADLLEQANFNMGQAAREFIENQVTDIKIKDFNRRLGDFSSTLKVLNKRSGGVPGGGGKLSQLLTRLTGAVVGSGQGPLGTIVGALTGDRVAGLMANPEISFAIIRKLMKGVPIQERNQILQQAQQILETRAKQVGERLALPSPSYIPVGPKTPNPSGVKVTPAKRGLPGQSPKTGKFFKTYTSTP